MSCKNPCGYVSEEFKKNGFECSSFVKGLFNNEPIIKSSFNAKVITIEAWLAKVANIMKNIECPVKFVYLIKFFRSSEGRQDSRIDIQIIFKNTKEYDFKAYPEQELRRMVSEYNKLKTAGEGIDAVYKFELTREFINYIPKVINRELDDIFISQETNEEQ